MPRLTDSRLALLVDALAPRTLKYKTTTHYPH